MKGDIKGEWVSGNATKIIDAVKSKKYGELIAFSIKAD